MPIQSIEVALKVKVLDGTETSTLQFTAEIGRCPDDLLQVPAAVAAALAKKMAIVSAGTQAQADKIVTLEKAIGKLTAALAEKSSPPPSAPDVLVAAEAAERPTFGKRSKRSND